MPSKPKGKRREESRYFLIYVFVQLTKVGQDLLMSICENCSTESPEDLETINHLVRIRVKSKPLATHYVACIKYIGSARGIPILGRGGPFILRTMIQQNPSNIPLTMTYVIYNELSQSGRNPNNMAVISMLFQTIPKAATKVHISHHFTLALVSPFVCVCFFFFRRWLASFRIC